MDKTYAHETLSLEIGILEVFCITLNSIYSSDILLLPVLSNGKMKGKNNSTNKKWKKNSSINDLLLFTIYCGIIFSFLILIWNMHFEYWNLVMSYFGIIVIFLIIMLIFILQKRRKFKNF